MSETIVTIHGDLDLDGLNGIIINVTNGATLIVKGALITRNNVSLNVDAASTFILESGLDAKNGSSFVSWGVIFAIRINGLTLADILLSYMVRVIRWIDKSPAAAFVIDNIICGAGTWEGSTTSWGNNVSAAPNSAAWM